LLDTGALVAALDHRDQFHHWVMREFSTIEKPFLSCEAVLTEASFLLQTVYGAQDQIMFLLETGVIEIPFRLDAEVKEVRELMKRYKSIPMSLADACLVRMAELMPNSSILTLDSDFRIYRKERNQMIDVVMPSNR
jgi:predicted nucleic acid-binding protein